MPEPARDRLLELLAERVRVALAGVDAPDVYAIEVALLDAGGARPPDAELSWNTEAHLARGSDLNRWNSGSWARSGVPLSDDESRRLAVEALAGCGIAVDPPPEEFSDAAAELKIAIHDAAARCLGDLARRLHAEGVLTATLGHDTLVLCHTGSDHDPWTRLTLDANPPELHGDFVAFHETEGVQDETF
jgi:hypothetical protein